MRVEIINKDEVKDIIVSHGLFACTCYDTDDKYADKVGKSVQNSGHWSGSRSRYINFRIYDVDRGTAEQMMRHEVGVKVPIEDQDNYYFGDVLDINPSNIAKNMASFRYIDKDGFQYAVPKTIQSNEKALGYYHDAMKLLNEYRRFIKDVLEEGGVPHKKATEDVNFILPRATTTTLTIGFTPEALIQFMNKRLCTRAQDEIREAAIAMKKEVADILPEFAEKFLQPQCKSLLWCPEGDMCCGAYPTKYRLEEIIKGMKC